MAELDQGVSPLCDAGNGARPHHEGGRPDAQAKGSAIDPGRTRPFSGHSHGPEGPRFFTLRRC